MEDLEDIKTAFKALEAMEKEYNISEIQTQPIWFALRQYKIKLKQEHYETTGEMLR